MSAHACVWAYICVFLWRREDNLELGSPCTVYLLFFRKSLAKLELTDWFTQAGRLSSPSDPHGLPEHWHYREAPSPLLLVLFVWGCAHATAHMTYVAVREQLARIGFSFPPCEYQGWNSYYQLCSLHCYLLSRLTNPGLFPTHPLRWGSNWSPHTCTASTLWI